MNKSKFFFVACEREGANSTLLLWGRNDKGKFCFKINDFEPFFYVLESEKNSVNEIPNSTVRGVVDGFKSIFGEALCKVIVKIPRNVPEIVELGIFSKVFESDIIFTRRFLIDTGIRTEFLAPEPKNGTYNEVSSREVEGA